MRVLVIPAILGLFMFQQDCDLAGKAGARPEQVQQSVVQGIRPYFPHAQARVLPDKRMIVAISCAQNIGQPVIEDVAAFLRTSPQVGQLRQLRIWGGVLGAPSYRFLRLGFEQAIVELDVDNGGIRILETDESYRSSYTAEVQQ